MLLVANVSTIVSAGLQEGTVVQLFTQDAKAVDRPLCQNAIVPELYAAELLIPILNLHQVGQCEIGEAKGTLSNTNGVPYWTPVRICEWIRAAYLAIATIVTSLAF